MRLKNGVYAHIDALAGTMVDIHLIVPNGILCLWSAWSVYNLTTQIPNAYYVAIKRSRKVVLPEYPEFQLIYLSVLLGKKYKGTMCRSLMWNVRFVMWSSIEIKRELM